MRNYMLAALLTLGLVGCGRDHNTPVGPYVNRFLTDATQEGSCVRVTMKTPFNYTGYLTVDGDDEATVLVYLNGDERVDGQLVSVEDVVICGLTLGESHLLRFEIRYAPLDTPTDPPYAGPAFGESFEETLEVFLEEVPPPDPNRPEITVDGVTITVTSVVCDVQVIHGAELLTTIVRDGSVTLNLEPGEYILDVQDCNGFIVQITVISRPEDEDPCTPNLNFLPTGGVDIVKTNRLQTVLDSLHLGGKARLDVTKDFVRDDLDSYWQVSPPDGFGPTEGEAAALIVIEMAGFAPGNVFGIYDPSDKDNRVPLFVGPDGSTAAVVLAVETNGHVVVYRGETVLREGNFSGTRFGFYLDSSVYAPQGGLFFSDSSLNSRSQDHMVAFQGDNDVVINPPGDWPAEVFRSNEFVLCFEDLVDEVAQGLIAGCVVTPRPLISDWDFEDMVILISGIRPKPCE